MIFISRSKSFQGQILSVWLPINQREVPSTERHYGSLFQFTAKYLIQVLYHLHTKTIYTNLQLLPRVILLVGMYFPSSLHPGTCLLQVQAVRLHRDRPSRASVPKVFAVPVTSSPLAPLSCIQPVTMKSNCYGIISIKIILIVHFFLKLPKYPLCFGNFWECNNYIRKSSQFVFSKCQIDMYRIFKWRDVGTFYTGNAMTPIFINVLDLFFL